MVQDGARWCEMVQDGARWCKMVQNNAIPCNTMQYHAIPCNIMQYHAMHCNTMQYHAILNRTMQYHAIPCNTMQYHALQCNTMQYHAGLITADGAYNCPVGSIWPFFYLALLHRRLHNAVRCPSCLAVPSPNLINVLDLRQPIPCDLLQAIVFITVGTC